MPRASVSSSITPRAVDVILFGLDYFINSDLSLCSYSAHTLFDNKLELIICNLGVSIFKVFYTLIENSLSFV